MRVQIDWSIHVNPIGRVCYYVLEIIIYTTSFHNSKRMSAEKLNWYVKNCFVKDIGENRKETGKNVPIITNQCYTQILSAKPISHSKVVTELFR